MIRRARASAVWRLALATAGVYALVTVLLGALVFQATHAVFLRQIDATIQESATALAVEYRDEGEPGLLRAISARESQRAEPLGYALFDALGHRVAGDFDTARPAPGWSDVAFHDPAGGPGMARGLALELAPDRHLLVVSNPGFVERVDRANAGYFGAALLGVLGLGALGAWLVGTALSARLNPVVDTADAIARGALDRRVPLTGWGDEFDRVAASLNLMLERVSALVANLRQVSGDVAHDLRTPLTRLRADLELAQRPGLDPATRDAIARAMEQSDRLLEILDATLRIAEIEEGTGRQCFAPLDLGALVQEVVEALVPVAEESGHRLVSRTATGCAIAGDRQLLAQALINLVCNALRHTPPGSRVVVEVAPRAAEGSYGPVVTVADNGPGVPPADRPRVVQRFVRLDAARATPGHGLGLSLVKAIADLHGARLDLDDNAPGLRVELAFPAA